MGKVLSIVICLLLSACMVGPNYKEPPKLAAKHWIKKSRSIQEKPFENVFWWNVFKDPVLTSLIYTGYQNNINLQIAGVHIMQARAQLAQSVGQLYPQQQGLGGNYNYNRIGGTSLQDVLPNSFLTATLGMSANWEIDFWGKYRRAIQSNDAIFLASLAAYDHALISLTGDIASTYVRIRTDQALIRVVQENIKVQRMGLNIAQSRFRAGETSLLDVEQAKTELAQTQSTLPSIVAHLQEQKDILAVLLGTVPTEIDRFVGKSHGIPKAPVTVAVGIPKETLARRPDIYEARMEAIAQSELIGATKANLFPSFSLAGTFYFASNNINGSSITDLFHWSNRNITAGPGFTWPILNYGQITNAVRMQDALFQQALLKYTNLVLKAQQEVQDNITRYIESKKAEMYLSTANHSAIKTTRLSFIRYKEGESDFTTVLNAEQQQLRVQLSLINAQGDIPLSLIALYRSLGGGWQIRGANDVVPLPIKMQMAARTNWGGLLAQPNHEYPATTGELMKQLYLPTW